MADQKADTNPLAALQRRESEILEQLLALETAHAAAVDALRIELRRTRSAVRSLLGTREKGGAS